MYRIGMYAVNLPYGDLYEDELRRLFMLLSLNEDEDATGVYSVAVINEEPPRVGFMTNENITHTYIRFK